MKLSPLALWTLVICLGPATGDAEQASLLHDRTWLEEAHHDAGELPPQVRAETIAYGQAGDTSITQVIHEGTVERYPFGHRQPTLVCAPLRVCAIILEAEETVLDVLVGDSQHWQILELSTGPGGTTPVVGVRPMTDFGASCDKTTNLFITTDRRYYSIGLAIPPCSAEDELDPNPQLPYHRELAFYYPDDILMRWGKRARQRRQEEAEAAARPVPPTLAATGVEDLNWSYRIRARKKPFRPGTRFPWRPLAVFDDGLRTYIRLPPEAREIPSVFEVTAGEDRLVSFKPAADDPRLLIVAHVAPHLVLVLPSGKRTTRLDLLNVGSKP